MRGTHAPRAAVAASTMTAARDHLVDSERGDSRPLGDLGERREEDAEPEPGQHAVEGPRAGRHAAGDARGSLARDQPDRRAARPRCRARRERPAVRRRARRPRPAPAPRRRPRPAPPRPSGRRRARGRGTPCRSRCRCPASTAQPRSVAGGVAGDDERDRPSTSTAPADLTRPGPPPTALARFDADAADEVGEAVGDRRARARAGPRSRQHHAGDPAPAASDAGRELDQDAEPDRPQRVPSSTARRCSAPSRRQLGEVDAEDEADEQPDHGDDEEADHSRARRRSTGWSTGSRSTLSRRPGTAYFTTVPRDRRAAATANTTQAVRRRPRWPRPGSPPATRTDPGRTGTRMPTQPDRDRPGRPATSVSHGAPSTARRTAWHDAEQAPDQWSGASQSVGGSVGVSAPSSGAMRGRVGELVGLVDDVRGDLAELVAVLAGVVGAEEQLAAGLELHAEVGLGPAAVAAVRSAQRGGLGATCSGHFGLISRLLGVWLNVAGGTQRFPAETWRPTPQSNHAASRIGFRSPMPSETDPSRDSECPA